MIIIIKEGIKGMYKRTQCMLLSINEFNSVSLSEYLPTAKSLYQGNTKKTLLKYTKKKRNKTKLNQNKWSM
jgi:hypothetical protein